LRSDEEKGATQLNTLYAGLAGSDYATVGENLELLFSARVVTVNEQYFSDYSLPYPDDAAGSVYRMQCWSADGTMEQIYIPTINPASDFYTFTQNLMASNLLLPRAQVPVVSINGMVFTPGVSY